ncbi:hypothetical protein SU69_03505 [Thermosipho melanesiensis]|uniref:Dockerin domain-containing protein n=2 Tax=Thermosipho melanesiensis TaxID=46541 RepID=A6LKU2_THEM4|nr:hypothetical protein [Thermosipho melanesiensis]ABR30543.1 hypothetical protein Tmel_0679 [Thermosipho melanesiensis BI429]APT73692.1 hypothetical protein BW47_03690 [Thermosipho melanesiensis]OOC35631.1 hypothetical protein SU68_03560 [Thermosipho melanesiensis]OOC39306.1 hypothetical protein SU69_03505 [Thermosipho melanesiensis]OOC39392.1 hypothetical protein SU70_03505 [Thermosipho melanesiensis]
MKKLVILILVFSVFLFALDISPLWENDYITLSPTGYVKGGAVALKQTGDVHVITKDAYYYVINRLGNIVGNYGSPDGGIGWKHISYPIIVGGNYIVYVTSNYDGKSYVNVRTSSTSKRAELIGNVSRAAVAFYDSSTGNIHIYVGIGVDGGHGVYHLVYDVGTDTFTVTNDFYATDAPVEITPILSPKKDALFVLDYRGNFYQIALDNSYNFDSSSVNKIQLGGEFETPMAYSEGFIYAVSRNGTLYKIPPEGTNSDVDVIQLGSSSMAAGVLVDSKGYVYVFDDLGTIHIIRVSDDLFKVASHSIYDEFKEGFRFATTPLLFKKTTEDKIYIFTLLNGETFGKAVVYSMDYNDYTFDVEWEKDLGENIPTIGSPAMVPLSSVNDERYIIAFTTNQDKVYAYTVDAKGPYGFWAMEAQNSYRTGFVDSNAPTFQTSITLKAKDWYSGIEISKDVLNETNGKYGVLFDATVVSISDSGDISSFSTYEYKTNPNVDNSDSSANDPIPIGRAGLDKLLIRFATETTMTLLFNDSFITNVTNDVTSAPLVDATFSFRQFDSGIPGLDVPYIESPLATILFGYEDKDAEVLVDSTYAILIKYNLPDSVASELISFGKDETSKTIDAYNPFTPSITIPSTAFAYRWKVYQWDYSSNNLTGYKSFDYRSIDSLDLGIDDTGRAPTYIEIFYTELTGTVTFVVPMYAENKARAFILIDAAKGALSSTLYATLTNSEISMSLATVTSIDINPSFVENTDLRIMNNDYLKFVFEETSKSGISQDTRVATISLWLDFATNTFLYFNNQARYFELFDIELYTQLKNNPVEKGLLSKNRFIANKYLTLPGDFNLDGVIDIDDYIMFRNALYNYQVNGIYDSLYDIGPRTDFSPPNRGYIPGFSEKDGKIDEYDLNVFLVMYGYTPPSTNIEYSGN